MIRGAIVALGILLLLCGGAQAFLVMRDINASDTGLWSPQDRRLMRIGLSLAACGIGLIAAPFVWS